MKFLKNKFLPIMLCAIMLSTQILFGCLTVRAHADTNPVQWFADNFSDAVSAIGGFVWNGTVDVWNAWKNFLGFSTEEEFNDYITNGVSVGGNNVTISDDIVNDIEEFCEDLKDRTPYETVYTTNFDDYFVNLFTNRSQYQAVKNLIRSSGVAYVCGANADSFRNQAGGTIGLQEGGTKALYICVPREGIDCFVGSYTPQEVNLGYYVRATAYKASWEDFTPYDDNWDTYCFSTNASTELTLIANSDFHFDSWWVRPSSDSNVVLFKPREGLSISMNGHACPCSIGYKPFLLYQSSEVMRSYSLGNLPYYQVPKNDIFSIDGDGNYSTTTTQIDNSISYGDISSYISNNNVSEYSTVINYINNYYNSGSGGSGGSGSGGSGSDIDWGWLGRIGEVIGGLISALGNIVAGIIDAISELITSVTEGIPNVFGQLLEWLFPFLPDYVLSLLSLTIMAVVIVSLIKLLRGK